MMRCAGFVAALAGLYLVSLTYHDYLFTVSHSVIKDLQEGHDTNDGLQAKVLDFFSEMTSDASYNLGIIFLMPFLSRERFWYYLTALNLASVTKSNLKMVQSEPRPVWVWNDLSDLGCSTSFGSPSGHSTRSANLAFLLILDQFFASEWSRVKFPSLNRKSVRTHKLAFVMVFTLACGFWLLNLFDRIWLGKHTLNQIVLGS